MCTSTFTLNFTVPPEGGVLTRKAHFTSFSRPARAKKKVEHLRRNPQNSVQEKNEICTFEQKPIEMMSLTRKVKGGGQGKD